MFTDLPGGASFVDHFCYLCFVFVMLSCLSISALWSPAGNGLTSWLACIEVLLCFVTLPCGVLGQMWCLIVSYLIFAFLLILTEPFIVHVVWTDTY